MYTINIRMEVDIGVVGAGEDVMGALALKVFRHVVLRRLVVRLVFLLMALPDAHLIMVHQDILHMVPLAG